MSLSVSEVGLVTQKLSESVTGAFLQKVRVTDPGRLFLEVRKPGKTFRIFICTQASKTRLCLSDSKEEGPVPSLAFQGLLRSRISGGQLTAIQQVNGDRTVRLDFRAQGENFALIAELTGRHGNVFLTTEDGKILGSATPSSSTTRLLRSGKPYVPPEVVDFEASSPKSAPRFSTEMTLEEISNQMEAIYGQREARERRETALNQAMSPLKARLKKLQRALTAAQGDLKKTSVAEDVRRQGELLKANLHRVRRGDTSVRVTSYSEEGISEVVLKLSPSMSPQDQVEALFRKYRHLSLGREKSATRIEFLEREIEGVRQGMAQVEASQTPKEGAVSGMQVDQAFNDNRPKSRRSVPTQKATPFREYTSQTGQKIWVGKSAKHNDALTFGCARGNDVWVHARGVPGSHVIVPLDRQEVLQDETLRDALELARHFSGHRNDAGEVSWTRVKYVRRQKGGGPGAVIYSQEKTVLVRPNQERLSRLSLSLDGQSS